MYPPREIVPLAARNANGNSAAVEARVGRAADTIALLVNLTAMAGTTPTMTLSLEWSTDGTNWAAADPADAFTALNSTANRIKVFEAKAPFYRVLWTLGGTTPSFTFQIIEIPNAD